MKIYPVKKRASLTKSGKKEAARTNPDAFILCSLLENQPNYVSGSQLADALKISRVGVWSRINKLRQSGLKINATQNLGYYLAEEPSDLNFNLIQAWLRKIACREVDLYKFKDVGSTNVEAEMLIADPKAKTPFVVLAESQSKGKGRLNNAWQSPPGGNLYMSIGFRPKVEILKLRLYTLYQAYRIVDFLRNELSSDQFMIKWPNDVYLNGKKVGGILTEASIDSERVKSLIFGFGLNVGMSPDVKNSRYSSSSLKKELKRSIPLNELTAKLIRICMETLRECLSCGISKEFLQEFKRFDYLKNKKVEVRLPKKTISGKAEGIDDSGGLFIKDFNGDKHIFHSGEIILL